MQNLKKSDPQFITSSNRSNIAHYVLLCKYLHWFHNPTMYIDYFLGFVTCYNIYTKFSSIWFCKSDTFFWHSNFSRHFTIIQIRFHKKAVQSELCQVEVLKLHNLITIRHMVFTILSHCHVKFVFQNLQHDIICTYYYELFIYSLHQQQSPDKETLLCLLLGD